VSVTERVAPLDPLALVEGVPGAGLGPGLPVSRAFWERPTDRFALAGIGAAFVVGAPREGDRFSAVAAAWKSLMQEAVVQDASGGAPGGGPALVGGFTFDPGAPRTPQWRDFPDALLVLPRLQLAAVDGEHWLTTNVLVDAQGEPDTPLEDVAAARLWALDRTASEHPPGREGRGTAAGGPLTLASARSTQHWREAVRAATAAVRGGELEKVVLAREVRAHTPHGFDTVRAIRYLRRAYPECFVFGFWHGGSTFLGASPERLVRADGRVIRASSLAGSIARGDTPDADRALADELRGSEKDLIEHAIVTRALRDGLGDLCDDVSADTEPSLVTLAQVHHLHTAVRAHLRDGYTLLDLVARLHPTPAVGGEPRDAALAFIREHEGTHRGWYAAPVGWMGRGHGEFAVALRSALVTGADASLYAGCGIVADSDPDAEYAESQLKLRPMELALADAAEPAAHRREASTTPWTSASGPDDRA